MSVISNLLRQGNRFDFGAINQIALVHLPTLARTWAPDGKMCGHEWVALNPTRLDQNPGSFSINVRTGKWADFSTGDRGGDPISLAAYLFGCRQIEAARVLATALGVRL